MSVFEICTLVLQILNLIVLTMTLAKLWQYTTETKRIAVASVASMPIPCVVLKQMPDKSDEAIVEGQAGLIAGQTLVFKNVRTALALAVRMTIPSTQPRPYEPQGIPLSPGEEFQSTWARNVLPDTATIFVEFESLNGGKYKTETHC